jgi:hypothetical protein
MTRLVPVIHTFPGAAAEPWGEPGHDQLKWVDTAPAMAKISLMGLAARRSKGLVPEPLA